MKFICKTFLGMGINFRDESNEPTFIMIGYSDATVTVLNYPLIVRSNASLDRALLQYHSCGGNFVIRLYLIPLISGQSIVSLSSKYFHTTTKHGLFLATNRMLSYYVMHLSLFTLFIKKFFIVMILFRPVVHLFYCTTV